MSRIRALEALNEVVLPGLTIAMLTWLIITLESIHCEIARMKDTLTRIEDIFDRSDAKRDGIDMHRSGEMDQVSRRELSQELHRQLEIRFDESGEGTAYGGPGLAAHHLLLRAKPEVDAALADLLNSPRAESAALLAQDISNDLWERRMQFLERTPPAMH